MYLKNRSEKGSRYRPGGASYPFPQRFSSLNEAARQESSAITLAPHSTLPYPPDNKTRASAEERIIRSWPRRARRQGLYIYVASAATQPFVVDGMKEDSPAEIEVDILSDFLGAPSCGCGEWNTSCRRPWNSDFACFARLIRYGVQAFKVGEKSFCEG